MAEVKHAHITPHNSVCIRTTGEHRHSVLHVNDSQSHGIRQCLVHAAAFLGVPVGYVIDPQADQDLLDHCNDLHSGCDCGEVLV